VPAVKLVTHIRVHGQTHALKHLNVQWILRLGQDALYSGRPERTTGGCCTFRHIQDKLL